MIAGLPLGFAQPLVLLGLLSLPLLWWLLRLGAAAPRAPDRFSADAAAVRDRTQGRNPVAHAVVADPAAADARRAGDRRCRRSFVESADRGAEPRRTAAADDRQRLGRGGKLGSAFAHGGRADCAR